MPNFITNAFQNLTGTNPALNYVKPIVPMKTITPQQTMGGIQVKDRGLTINPSHLDTLRKVLFAEISNRSIDKQQLEARTIINTALNRMKQQGKSLQDIITAPKQYQGYGSKEYQRISAGKTTLNDAQKLKAIDTVLAQLKSGNFPDTIGGRTFYTHQPDGRILATAKF